MKIAIATLNGTEVAPGDLTTARGFIIFDVSIGITERLEFRPNRRSRFSAVCEIRPRDIARNLADCLAVIAGSASAHSRDFLESEGMEVIISNEPLVDRAAALMALNRLPDDSRVDPEDLDVRQIEQVVFEDGFDA